MGEVEVPTRPVGMLRYNAQPGEEESHMAGGTAYLPVPLVSEQSTRTAIFVASISYKP
jgi:hypothetical protein